VQGRLDAKWDPRSSCRNGGPGCAGQNLCPASLIKLPVAILNIWRRASVLPLAAAGPDLRSPWQSLANHQSSMSVSMSMSI
jgi:hypothetical protein